MTADITIKTWKQATNHSPSGDFNVTYLTAEDGKQFTVYDNTPGTGLIAQDAKVTLHYKQNVKDGKTFNNCFGITQQNTTPKGTGEQMLETLRNIQELLQQVLTMNPNTFSKPVSNNTTDPATDNGLPF